MHMNLTFTTKEERDKYESWTKEQIYKAYLLEVGKVEKITVELNRAYRRLAEARYVLGKEK